VSDKGVLLDAYARALEAYVGGAGEAALAEAYELGRGALVAEVSVTDLATVHHAALLRVLGSDAAEHMIVRAGELLSEMMAPFEMTQRGFRHAVRVLAESQRQTQIANEELQAFSYSVAHDLRAPLRAIDGFGQALAEDNGDQLDETGRGHLEQILDSAKRMGRLIDDLLRLSRIGRSELRRQAVDLSDVARTVCGALARSHGERNVDWHVQDGMQGDADPQLLRVAFENLLGNAWKFTARTSSPRVRCTCATLDRLVVYTVDDNGAGFDPAHAARLFSPFQRLHSAKEFDGNGIGLAIVQRVIRRHGGEIWAEGRIDAGATFHFTLEGPRP
jgi:light-regulated signal transduction histidine kinase (bacteriophytochrome)